MGNLNWKPLILILFIFGLAGTAYAQTADLDGLDGVSQSETREMRIISPPTPQPSLRERMVNSKLTREFTERYEEQFGRTEAQRRYNEIYVSSNRSMYYDRLEVGRSASEEDAERRAYGQYMVRRLVEYHADMYLKSDPATRPLLKVKEQLSGTSVQVSKGVKVKAQYSISGGYLDTNVENPWLESKLRVHVGRNAEQTLTVGRPITSSIRAESFYKFQDGIVGLIGRKTLTPALSTSLLASTYTRESGKTRRESLYMAGLSYTF